MQLTEVMRIDVAVEPPSTTGVTPLGETRVIAFEGGTFEGAELRGRLLPGGSDWQRVREDGVLEIRAHYMLETDEGERIEVISEGLRSGTPEVLARLAEGQEVPPGAYYFRTFIRLNTAADRLTHFNHRLYIGVGERRARDVRIVVFAVP